MKSKLGVAIALATLAPAISFAEPTVYGKLNVAFEPLTDEGGNSHTSLVDNASRFGIKGSEEVSEGLSAIYVVEFSTRVDGTDGSDEQVVGRRNIYAGFKGGFGQFIAGVFDTPTKMAQGKIDQFGDLRGDIASTLTVNDNRTKNSIMYSTPGENFKGNVMYMTREEDGADDGISASVTYTADSYYLAAAYDSNVEEVDSTNLRLVGALMLDALELGAMYEQYDLDSEDDAKDAIFLSVGYKVGEKTKLKAQFGQSDEKVDVDEKAQTISIGVDHSYSKNVTTYAYYTADSSDEDEIDNSYLGLGAILKF